MGQKSIVMLIAAYEHLEKDKRRNKMRTLKAIVVVGILALGACAPASAYERSTEIKENYGTKSNFIEGIGGNNSYGVRGGHSWEYYELSLGYLNANIDGTNEVNNAHINVLDVEAYGVYPIGYSLKVKAGGGVGYGMPNLEDGTSQTADNSNAWVLATGLDYAITSSWNIGFMAKGLFFNTDTHKTIYSSHPETLNTGQAVEVLDVSHEDNVSNFNSLLFTAGIRYNW